MLKFQQSCSEWKKKHNKILAEILTIIIIIKMIIEYENDMKL